MNDPSLMVRGIRRRVTGIYEALDRCSARAPHLLGGRKNALEVRDRQEGRNAGRQEGRKAGRQEGRKAGRQEGRKAGRQEGRKG